MRQFGVRLTSQPVGPNRRELPTLFPARRFATAARGTCHLAVSSGAGGTAVVVGDGSDRQILTPTGPEQLSTRPTFAALETSRADILSTTGVQKPYFSFRRLKASSPPSMICLIASRMSATSIAPSDRPQMTQGDHCGPWPLDAERADRSSSPLGTSGARPCGHCGGGASDPSQAHSIWRYPLRTVLGSGCRTLSRSKRCTESE